MTGLRKSTNLRRYTQDEFDAANRLRSNHLGTQPISTVSGLQGKLDEKAATSDLASTDSGKGGSLVALAHGMAKVPATAIDRHLRQLFVTDAPFFADSAGIDDMSAAFQTAYDYGIANGFGEIILPGGEFKWLNPVVCDQAAQTTTTGRRLSIKGAGQRGSVAKMSGEAYTALTLIGSNTPGAADAQIMISDLFFDQPSKNGTALSINRYSHMDIARVRVNGSDLGIALTDVQESKLDNVLVAFANYGLRAQPGSFTSPNNMMLLHCKMGNNRYGGAEFVNCAQINIIGGSYEGNHFDDDTDPALIKYGIRAVWTDAGKFEGTVGLNVWGAYIEANGMPIPSTTPTGDIWIVNSVAPSVNNIFGCSFQRHDEFFCTNNIRMETSGGFKHMLNLIGNGHQGFHDYVPDAGRKYVALSTPAEVFVDDRGNRYVSNLERPDFTAFNNDGSDFKPQAYCRFAGAGATGSKTALQSSNIAFINKVSTGVYEITYARSLAGPYNVYSISLAGNVGTFAVTSETEDVVTLETFTVDGTTHADFQVSFIVHGRATA